LIGGIAAVALSFLLPMLMSAENTWSSSSAEGIQKAGENIQKLVGQLTKAKDPGEQKRIKADIEKLQTEHQQMQASLEGAVKRPFWIGILFQILGTGLIIGGFWLWYMVPMPKEKPLTLAELDPDGTLANKEVTALDYTSAVRASRSKSKH
jgi:hypothetical protein